MSQSSNMSNASSVSDLVSQRCMPELDQDCKASDTNNTDGFVDKAGPPH
jgi:hypothetical protein